MIKEWWENRDSVTLITRSRRFGKTLNMSMIEQFFSVDYAGRSALFEGLSIWEETGRYVYMLALTNREVTLMFETMIQGWFREEAEDDYNDFTTHLCCTSIL